MIELLEEKRPLLKTPPPWVPALFWATVLLLIVRDCPFQMPPPSPVATLPLTVLPSIVMEPRFAKTPPPYPRNALFSTTTPERFPFTVLPPPIAIAPLKTVLTPPPTSTSPLLGRCASAVEMGPDNWRMAAVNSRMPASSWRRLVRSRGRHDRGWDG